MSKKLRTSLVVIGTFIGISITVYVYFFHSQLTLAQTPPATLHWPMAGHDIERTSFANETPHTYVKNPRWQKHVNEYIPQEAQLVSYPGSGSRPGLIFVATSGGVYALSETDGSTFWFYQTSMPVGNSPTIANDIAYIPAFDKTIHAVNINSGQKVWQTDSAGAGFDTSPLVVNGTVYAGSRDGNFYAFNASNGQYKWHYPVGVSTNSAAYKDGVVYFGSKDSYAYALNATTGALVWKSVQFPGEGFTAYWPVIYGSSIIFPGSAAYFNLINEQFLPSNSNPVIPPNSLPAGVAADANGWHDASTMSNYFTQNPQRRTSFMLSRATGQETFASMPILLKGNNSGVRQPPAIGPNHIVYFNAPYKNTSAGWLKGDILAWNPTNNTIKPAGTGGDSNDELDAISLIGNYLYYNHKEDQVGGAYNVSSIATGTTPEVAKWLLRDLEVDFPNFYADWDKRKYGSMATNGHGTQGSNPPIPLGNNVYFHRSNTIVSYGP